MYLSLKIVYCLQCHQVRNSRQRTCAKQSKSYVNTQVSRRTRDLWELARHLLTDTVRKSLKLSRPIPYVPTGQWKFTRAKSYETERRNVKPCQPRPQSWTKVKRYSLMNSSEKEKKIQGWSSTLKNVQENGQKRRVKSSSQTPLGEAREGGTLTPYPETYTSWRGQIAHYTDIPKYYRRLDWGRDFTKSTNWRNRKS